ncbi:MAG TPA: molybdopterin molybdotransferase MoeA [Nitrososphaerales archaeon]|nr:molybdopterin molybdotransferase MoeA [Nitrososphaerales archaeon]
MADLSHMNEEKAGEMKKKNRGRFGHNADEDEEGHTHYHGVDKAEQHIGVDQALEMFLGQIVPVRPVTVTLDEAWNRVLFQDIISEIDIPKQARSTRDGFAIRLPGHAGAAAPFSEFSIVGEVRIGAIPTISLKDGQAALVATGSYVPDGTSAVMMKEYAKVRDGNLLTIEREATAGENILAPGADISRGDTVLKAGTRLRPNHIALLAMLGWGKVRVYRRPRVGFFSTGDELMDVKEKGLESSKKNRRSDKKKEGGGAKIYDSNRPFIKAALQELGAEPCDLGIARDNFDEIRAKMLNGLRTCDALFLSAGSSVGERDYVGRAADSIKGVRMLVHGVAMRPSSPTGLATYQGKPFVLLPGFPTSAIVSFFVFGLPVISKLSGLSLGATEGGKKRVEALAARLGVFYQTISATLLDEYHGKPGIKHFLRVRVTRDRTDGGERYLARIVKPTEAYHSKWLAEANGIAVIDEDKVSAVMSGNKEVPVLLFGNVGQN